MVRVGVPVAVPVRAGVGVRFPPPELQTLELSSVTARPEKKKGQPEPALVSLIYYKINMLLGMLSLGAM
jgi:hypothetical protein